jgi:hypothetical protein
VLVHDVDTVLTSVSRVTEANLPAVKCQRAGSGLQIPGKNGSEGALSCAVLAEQRVNLAASKRKRHVVKGDDVTESLRNAVNLDVQAQNSSFGTSSSPFMISANLRVK